MGTLASELAPHAAQSPKPRIYGFVTGMVEPVTDAMWNALTVCRWGLQNRRGPRPLP